MKNGFELLINKNLTDSLNLDELELKYGIKIPPIYRLFVESFDLGEGNIKKDILIENNNPHPYYLSGFIFEPNPEASIVHFNTIETVLSLSYEAEIELWSEYLPIAAPGFNGAIVVGLEGNDIDKVFLHDIEVEPYLTFLSSNIFEFVRGLVSLPNTFYLGSKFSLDKIYKNWGEDFWRIREDKSE